MEENRNKITIGDGFRFGIGIWLSGVFIVFLVLFCVKGCYNYNQQVDKYKKTTTNNSILDW